MIVYHGSPKLFEKFDYSKIRTNGTSEGAGFYFTDTKRIANNYAEDGYVYTAKLNGKKPMSDNELTITKREARKVLEYLHEEIEFLSNYGEVEYEGYESVLESALDNEYDFCETDTDFLGSLYNSCGENPDVILAFYKLFGYDHIVSIPKWGSGQKVYVALTNDIIEIIDIESKSLI